MEDLKQKPISSKTGSKSFLKELLKRKFSDARSILLEMKGNDVTKDFFREHGFKSPILVREMSDLGIKVPPVTDLNILLKFLVPDLKDVDVIDVEKQSTFKMSVIEYFKYIMSPVKTRILNLISMEVSKTRLNEFIEPPKIVRDIDWIHCYWNRTKEGHKSFVPSSTEKYCLISPANSFTDFHVDFSGTSVWYHIVSGVKDFFLIRPSSVNSHLFWKWSSSYHKEAHFFGDQVDECYKLTIHAGETLLLPTGWIHAVYTPVDSLVYGGNFLHTYNAKEQFAVYDMEVRENVAEKYVYPHFRELNWFAAEGLCKEIDTLLETTDILSVPNHLINAIKVALPNLKGWSTKLSVQEKSFFNSDQLFKQINKILRLHERAITVRNMEKRESTRVKKRPITDDYIHYEDFKVKKGKGQAEAGTSSTSFPENFDDLSLNAWKVRMDNNKTLSVIIKRCSSSVDSLRFVNSDQKTRDWSSIVPVSVDEEVPGPSTGDHPINPPPKTNWIAATSAVDDAVVLHSVHQDDEYIYPALDFSDDEEQRAIDTDNAEDKAWAPSSKSISVAPRKERPLRVGKTKIAVEKGLEAAAAKPTNTAAFPLRKFIPPIKKAAPPRLKVTTKSSALPPMEPSSSSANRKGKGKCSSSKKGTTAKQRLGKILKIHRMRQ